VNIAQAILANSYPRYSVHQLSDTIHHHINELETNLGYLLGKMEQLSAGHSPETLPMIRLEADAKLLRTLAEHMEWVHMQMTAPERT
jgi:hypothetical protein